MRRSAPLKLLSEVRDLQVVDSEGRNCGVVDEIELAGAPGKALRIKALLIGPGAWRGRLHGWVFALVRQVAGERITRVPWSAVDHVTGRVFLNRKAEALGLMQVEDRLAAGFRRWRL
jgi:sporulation protein YlmC with PRC-barrel domain